MRRHGQMPHNAGFASTPAQVLETSTGAFHQNPEDTLTAYVWKGDRIWPSGAFLSGPVGAVKCP